jgi:hypothetical protein
VGPTQERLLLIVDLLLGLRDAVVAGLLAAVPQVLLVAQVHLACGLAHAAEQEPGVLILDADRLADAGRR